MLSMLAAHAGPGVFTEGVLEALAPGEVVQKVNLTELLHRQGSEWRKAGTCIVSRAALDARLRNLFSSTQEAFWSTGTWGSWFKDRQRLRIQHGIGD